jgi:hypothetical protein
MTAVFLKSDVEPTSELAKIEVAVAYFLSVLNPAVKIDTTFNAGDVVVNITEQQRHQGAYGYHVLLNGVPTAFCSPKAVGREWGHYLPAMWKPAKKLLGKTIVPASLIHGEQFTPGLITIIAHEIAEALSDGDVATYATDQLGREILVEVCDWVEGTYWAKNIGGNMCVFPNVALLPAFTDVNNKVGPYDILGLVKAPFQYVGDKKMAWGKINNGPLTRFV